jgi:hypothetical protein
MKSQSKKTQSKKSLQEFACCDNHGQVKTAPATERALQHGTLTAFNTNFALCAETLSVSNGNTSKSGELEKMLASFSSNDISRIEETIRAIDRQSFNALCIIGMGLVKIERQKLYAKAGFKSYLEYAKYLFPTMKLSSSTLSEYKTIMGSYIKHYRALCREGFVIEGNYTKLRHLEEALENHDKITVFHKITELNLRDFKKWAKSKKQLPSPPAEVEDRARGIVEKYIHIDGDRIGEFTKKADANIRAKFFEVLYQTFYNLENGFDSHVVAIKDMADKELIEDFMEKLDRNRRGA